MSTFLNRLPIINDVLDGVRTGATTTGVSPKALAPIIAVAITWGLHKAGLNLPDELVLIAAGSVAAYLLPPGRVAPRNPGAVHPDEVGPSSDTLLTIPDEVAATIEGTTAATGRVVGQAGDVLEVGSDVGGVAVTGVGQAVGAVARGLGGLLRRRR
jgi:hypothetical protein